MYRLCDTTAIATPIRGLQVFGLACHLAFVAFALATARRFLTGPRAMWLAAILVTFWPYGVECSVRVHNDSLATPLVMAATYFLVRYWQDDDPDDLYRAAIATALGLLTKSSAYAMVAAVGAIVLVRLWRSSDRKRVLGRGAIAALILATAVLLNARGKETPTSAGSPLCHLILGTACDIGQHQWVPNTLTSYLWLDLPSFVRDPWVYAERDDGGRLWFWNHLLKSSLFGTHNAFADAETSFGWNRPIAFVMGWLLLAMVAYLAGGALAFARRAAIERFAPLLATLASCLALMIAFRALVPAPHHTDFRHVYALVGVVATLWAATAVRMGAVAPWLERLAWTLAVALALGSVAYFAPKQAWMVRTGHHVVALDATPYAQAAREGILWNAPGNLVIDPTETVELRLRVPTTVASVDLSLDHNDRYAIEVMGDEPRRVEVGPRPEVGGLARYVLEFEEPVANVRAIRVTPLEGDYAYSLGHLIVR